MPEATLAVSLLLRSINEHPLNCHGNLVKCWSLTPQIAIYLGGMSLEGKEKILLTVASQAQDTFAQVGDGKNYAKLYSIERVIKTLA